MKKILPLFAFLFLFAAVQAQGGVAIKANNGADYESAEVTLKGKLVHKPWSKSTESYCAQGSDYYAVEEEGATHVLQLKNPQTKSLKRKVGKTVQLKGKFVTRTIESPGDDMQHPVSVNPETGETSGDFSCTVFEVAEVLK